MDRPIIRARDLQAQSGTELTPAGNDLASIRTDAGGGNIGEQHATSAPALRLGEIPMRTHAGGYRYLCRIYGDVKDDFPNLGDNLGDDVPLANWWQARHLKPD